MNYKRHKILIIDKNAGGSFLLMSILKDWGHEIFSLNSFLKAIDYSKTSYTPDLVIVDMQEPGMLFYEFPRKFIERTGITSPIVVHSAIRSKEIVTKSIQAGYKDYLMRPMDPEILHDKIDTLLNPDMKLSQKTFNFNLNEDAKITCPVHINLVNEFGIQASVPYHFVPGMVFDLQSPILQGQGLDAINVRVVEVQTQDVKNDSAYPYLIKLDFVGLTNTELIKLRKLAIFKGEVA